MSQAQRNMSEMSQRAEKPQLPAWAEHVVKLLDDRFVVPGTNIRFGLDSLLGLIPGGGDALGSVATLSLFALALQKQVPREVLTRMALNVALDAAVGSVPVLGDLFDVAFKANRRNLSLIEKSLQSGQPGAQLKPRWQDRAFMVGIMVLVVCALALPLVVVGVLIGYALK